MPILLLFFVVLFLAVFIAIAFYVFRKSIRFVAGMAINTVLGFLAIFLLNLLGFGIPVNCATLAVTALFGLLGVAVLAILAVFGML